MDNLILKEELLNWDMGKRGQTRLVEGSKVKLVREESGWTEVE